MDNVLMDNGKCLHFDVISGSDTVKSEKIINYPFTNYPFF
jgi:hypothetical protein